MSFMVMYRWGSDAAVNCHELIEIGWRKLPNRTSYNFRDRSTTALLHATIVSPQHTVAKGLNTRCTDP
jgi:hypothetical protein